MAADGTKAAVQWLPVGGTLASQLYAEMTAAVGRRAAVERRAAVGRMAVAEMRSAAGKPAAAEMKLVAGKPAVAEMRSVAGTQAAGHHWGIEMQKLERERKSGRFVRKKMDEAKKREFTIATHPPTAWSNDGGGAEGAAIITFCGVFVRRSKGESHLEPVMSCV
jgi:hypothetical protein